MYNEVVKKVQIIPKQNYRSVINLGIKNRVWTDYLFICYIKFK